MFYLTENDILEAVTVSDVLDVVETAMYTYEKKEKIIIDR